MNNLTIIPYSFPDNNSEPGLHFARFPIIPEIHIKAKTKSIGWIYFEEKKKINFCAQPHEILFVKSADHYMKSLIQYGLKKKWMIRHCSMKELVTILPPETFIRLNKFYLLNRNHFLGIDVIKKMLYFHDGFSIPVPHRISPFILTLLKK